MSSQLKIALNFQRAPYFRIVGIQVDTQGSGRSTGAPVRPEEEEAFIRLAAQPSIYETIAKSIAPSIYGSIIDKIILITFCL
jgi:DNA replication licensing factor MCM5